ncbi:MAG: HEPN domain-containing protein [Sulfurimonas sp.]|uniref:HEPN domain-containing protein n=1 Tax=Sulfurimonas sp. TaxID=2022749 RepID=UPI002634DEF8|nr:HEPN domain-containing protein [Sulfurimonas sp.]MDD5373623.1 HEPN domain-containing protein [Sulfurimonas sp.]
MRAFTKEWLKAANDDLLTINEIINNNFLTHIVAFHAQQSVEKTLKALLEDARKFYDFANSVFEKVCTLLNISIDEIKAQ